MRPDHHEQVAHALFRESNDALFLFNPTLHRVVDVNPPGLRMTGLSRRAILGMPVWELFSGDRPDAMTQLMEAYARTGVLNSREGYSLKRASGALTPVSLHASRIHVSPEPLGLIVARDVSERSRAAEALRQSETRYRRLVESAGIIDWAIHEDGTILALNNRTTLGGGALSETCSGRNVSELTTPEDFQLLDELARCILLGEVVAPFETRFHTRDGHVVHAEVLSIDVDGVPGNRVIHGISRDLSAQLSAVQALSQIEEMERAKEAAELANRTKSIFLANISHEIRTPMTAVLGLTDLLLTDPVVQALTAERLEDLRTIRQSGHYLLDLINDLLDLTKVDVGKLRIELRPCSPTQIVAEVVASLLPRATAKRLALEIEPPSGLPAQVATDPIRLRQILINLVANAIKFTESGRIQIRFRLEPGVDAASSCLCIDVADTGIGMSEQEIARLYEPFYSSSRQPFSAGLGLALSKRLAEMLGGQLSAQSVPGIGSTFTLTIPANQPIYHEEPVAVPSRTIPKLDRPQNQVTRLDGLGILLVEDNDASRRVISLHLERFGARIVTATDGQNAIEQALAHRDGPEPVDLILMDMQMPVLDGYEATRQLRALGMTIPIIAVTAYATPEDRDECLRIGCDEHLSKPIDWPVLLSLISGLARRSTQAVQGSS